MTAFTGKGPLTEAVKKILGKELTNRAMRFEVQLPADGPRKLVVEFYVNEDELLKGELNNG